MTYALREFMRWLALPLLRDFYAVMMLKWMREGKRLTPDGEKYGKPLLYTGLVKDVLYNIFWASLYFLDPPRELLVTTRLKRYAYGYRAKRLVRNGWRFSIEEVQIDPATGWRLRETYWLADNFLDPAEPDGRHV